MPVRLRLNRRRTEHSSCTSDNLARSGRRSSHLGSGSTIFNVAVFMVDLPVECDPLLIRCDSSKAVFAPGFKIVLADCGSVRFLNKLPPVTFGAGDGF